MEVLIEQINEWHISRNHRKIIETIMALPEHERGYELTCLLGRAFINEDEYAEALKVLDSIHSEYSDNASYCFRYGLALYHLRWEYDAVMWFEKALERGLEEIDDMPGTYYPKSVAKWLERARLWGPRRLEKNAFEEKQRVKRKTTNLNSAGFTEADLEGLWNDSTYSLEKYVGRAATDLDIAKTEEELGYCLPLSYKALIKQHNGGLVARDTFKNPFQCQWTPRVFEIDGIYGIDCDKPYSLCGQTGSKFWINEWGYPDIGIAIGDCPSGGHDMIFLDYSDCGPTGEPCVVHINQESDYEITYLADNFAEFVRGLITGEE